MAVQDLNHGLQLLSKRTMIVRIALYIFLVSSALAIPLAIAEATGSLNLAADNGPVTIFAALVFIVQLLDLIVCFVVVAMWIYRAHDNLRLANYEGLEFTPGWAVGWYFIPFANLFKPYQAMRELWKTSHGIEGYASEAGSLLPIWWGAWIIGNIVSNASLRMAMQGEGVMQSPLNFLDALGTAITLVSAWCLLRIVNKVHNAQTSSLGVAPTFA